MHTQLNKIDIKDLFQRVYDHSKRLTSLGMIYEAEMAKNRHHLNPETLEEQLKEKVVSDITGRDFAAKTLQNLLQKLLADTVKKLYEATSTASLLLKALNAEQPTKAVDIERIYDLLGPEGLNKIDASMVEDEAISEMLMEKQNVEEKLLNYITTYVRKDNK